MAPTLNAAISTHAQNSLPKIAKLSSQKAAKQRVSFGSYSRKPDSVLPEFFKGIQSPAFVISCSDCFTLVVSSAIARYARFTHRWP
jgi:hypothetical protein